MSPELEQAVKERVSLGHTKEQITAELQAAGYDNQTIESIYASVTGVPAADIPPATGKLIGYGELISGSFSMVKNQWKLLLTSSLYGFVWLVAMAVLFYAVMATAQSAILISILLGLGLVVLGLVGMFALTFGFQRALLFRNESATYLSHVIWSAKNIGGLFLVALYVQFVTSLGYVLLVLPGIAMALYLSYAMMVRVSGEETGVKALVKSTEIVYNRWWGVFGRGLVVGLVFMLCLAPIFLVVVFAWGEVNMLTLSTGSALNDLLFPALIALVFLGGIVLVALLMQCSMVLLYESLRDTAQPWAPDKHQKLYKWMRVAVLVGIIPAILINGYDFYSKADNGPADLESMFEPAGLELDHRSDQQAEQEKLFNDFMEEFGAELDSDGLY